MRIPGMSGVILLGLALAASPAAAAPVNLLTNGSFETLGPGPEPETAPGYVRLGSGSTRITGWTVIGPAGPGSPGDVDWTTYWQHADGRASLELAGGPAGGIEQTFAVTPGRSYVVRFFMAAHPEDPAGTAKSIRVQWIDGPGGNDTSETVDTPPFPIAGRSITDMGWLERAYTFTATTDEVTLRFISLSCCAFGPAIDGVRVTEVPLPLALPLFLSALGVLGALGRTRAQR